MGENKTPDLPVQIIQSDGGPPLAVLPLPVLIALVGIARREIERAESESDKDRLFHRAVELASVIDPDGTKVANQLRNLFVQMGQEQDDLGASLHGNFAPRVESARRGFKEAFEEIADRAAYLDAKAADEEALPLEVIKRLAADEHPVKVFRDHRGLTQAKLAERVGTTAAYLSQIETGRREGSRKLLRALSKALDVELADLLTD